MGARTYIPTLLRIVERICKFAAKYQTQIRENLTTPQREKFDLLVVACNAFVSIVGVLPIGD